MTTYFIWQLLLLIMKRSEIRSCLYYLVRVYLLLLPIREVKLNQMKIAEASSLYYYYYLGCWPPFSFFFFLAWEILFHNFPLFFFLPKVPPTRLSRVHAFSATKFWEAKPRSFLLRRKAASSDTGTSCCCCCCCCCWSSSCDDLSHFRQMRWNLLNLTLWLWLEVGPTEFPTL